VQAARPALSRSAFGINGKMIRYVVIALLFACGPSAQEIKSAKDARYNGNINDMLDIAVSAAKEVGYEVNSTDVDYMESTFVTRRRWYEYNGQAAPHLHGNEYRGKGESLLVGFRVKLEHVEGAHEMIRLDVSPGVKSNLVGDLEPHNPRIPSWVDDRTNELWIAAHKNLARFEVRGP
jgi:hypothetical protein